MDSRCTTGILVCISNQGQLMKRLVITLLLLQGCSAVSHHELEHRCSANCNEFIDNMKTFEFDSMAKLTQFFNGKEVELCEQPIGTFSCAE